MSSEDKTKRRRRGYGEGTISQYADGRRSARVDLGIVDGKRKRKAIYGKTRNEVADKLRLLLTQHQQGVNVAPERQTVAQFLERWLTDVVAQRCRPRTYATYRQIVRLCLATSHGPSLGHIPLAKLTPQHVQAHLRALQRQGLASSCSVPATCCGTRSIRR